MNEPLKFDADLSDFNITALSIFDQLTLKNRRLRCKQLKNAKILT